MPLNKIIFLKMERSKYGKFKILRANDGRFYFKLLAKNGMVLATSQMYASAAACLNSVASVQENAQFAEIEDCTEKQ